MLLEFDTRRRLPSLTALRHFEAVARHLSFTKAAEELCLTQAAVSHQVRALEDELGAKLFRRLPQRTEITEHGRELYSVLRTCFDQIANTAMRIQDDGRANRLRINVTPLFSAKFLVPRLSRFLVVDPVVDLILHHTFGNPDPDDTEVEAVITFGNGQWDGFDSDYLFSADLVPLCNPEILNGKKPPLEFDDLSGLHLLHEFSYRWWEAWISQVNAHGVSARKGTIFDDPNALTNAAVQGQGVFLGAPLYLQELISSGQLVAPFGEKFMIPIDYYLLHRSDEPQSKRARSFRTWLLREADDYGRSLRVLEAGHWRKRVSAVEQYRT
ncbi:MAG: LysR substrate-binding domain-containing protein [Dongiaceae bacterium]